MSRLSRCVQRAFEKMATDAMSSRAGIDEQASDVRRRKRGPLPLDELHERSRCRAIQRDVSDELPCTNRHPRT